MKLSRDIGYLALALSIGISIRAGHADELRIEAGVGRCQHNLAPDASWHYAYGGYQTDMTLRQACGQLGLLWKLDRTFGLRAAYVDLGRIDADNTYPVDEPAYFRAKDTRTAVASSTARFQGHGQSRGFTLGPVLSAERYALEWSAEAGVAALYNEWHVPALDNWAFADGWNATWYGGLGARYKYLFVAVRRYANVHASQASENPLFVGPTSGPVIQTLVGVSVAL